jgi:hypothetical protein
MKGIIYTIRSHQTDNVYYGSTTQTLCKRMACHRRGYKCWLNGTKKYITSYEILKYQDAYIEFLEEVEFQNKKELHAKEGHYIRHNECVNKVIPCRTKSEYIVDNKDKKRDYDIQYRADNQEAILIRKKEYNDANRDKIKEYNQRYKVNRPLN